MMRVKATLAYDGTSFYGWQVQKDLPTIQAAIEAALQRICGKHVSITGAGRTDSGVHAYQQVAHFDWEHSLPSEKLALAMNALLSSEIRILSVSEVHPEFHARFNARSKSYLYRIDRSRHSNPFTYRYSMHYSFPLDFDRMHDCARLIEGEHGFSAFQATGSDIVNPRRTVSQVEVLPDVVGMSSLVTELNIRIHANGFLRKMVRFLVGTMLEIASGKRPLEDLRCAIDTGEKKCVGVPAPACGLFLEQVYYE